MAVASRAEVVINEIMYHPQSEDVREEFIELLNNGPESVDLTGWQFVRGVRYAIPPGTALAPGGILVICADPVTFAATHPGVANFLGGWDGILSNSGQDIVLEDGLGQVVDRVDYADDGDWAIRRRGSLDYGHRGWTWTSAADGAGHSLELINPQLNNNTGQNWTASPAAGGTPGISNPSATNNIAPLISDAGHFSIVPRSAQPIAFAARLQDESTNGLSLRLHWRTDGAIGFSSAVMVDDGTGVDGLPGDLEFAVQIPAQTNRAIIEYFFEAQDADGRTRYWPATSRDLNDQPLQVNNALLQVDDSDYVGNQPVYRMILTAADRAELYQINRNNPPAPEPQPAPFNDQTRSHARFNATFVSTDGTGTVVRHLAGVRNRGNGSRTALPQSYNVAFTRDETWKDQVSLNLNSQYPPYQLAGAAIMQFGGVVAADSRAVQVRLNGENLTPSAAPSFGFYVANEVVNSEFARHHFPLDPSGNAYRGVRLDSQGGANLRYQGATPGPYRTNYFKQTNTSEDDWSDLILLTDTLSNTPSATYLAAVTNVVDVPQWLRYFAVNTIIDNNETSLANGDGDDYYLYAGVADPRFRLIPYDLDTVLGLGGSTVSNGLFRMTAVPALNRLIKHPEVAPRYYEELRRQLDTTFTPAKLEPLLANVLGGQVSQGLIDGLKNFVANRGAFIRSQIPLAIAVTNDLAISNGYFRATSATVALRGRADAIRTRQVLVNGAAAVWSAWDARWTNAAVALNPGLNRVVIHALDAEGVEFEEQTVDVWYDTGGVTSVAGTLAGSATWTPAGGPYRVTSTVTVPDGVTLTILPGTTVYFAAGAGLTVNGTGRLLAEGTREQRIRLTRDPAGTVAWSNLQFNNTIGESRLVHVDLEYAGNSRCVRAANAILLLDDVRFAHSTVQYVDLINSSFIIRHCNFPTTAGVELIHGSGLPAAGYGIFEGNFFGGTSGLNDIIDFTGGKRPGAIVQVLNNVFSAGSDDCLDFDGTDAHVEGNIFMHTHQTVSLVDSSSAISGGENAGVPSHVVIARNWFYDVDHLALAKENNFYAFMNNTALKVRVAGVVFDEPGRRGDGVFPGRGAWLDGNVLADAPANFEDAYVNDPQWGTLDITLSRSLMPASDLINNGPGNFWGDPRFVATNGITFAGITNQLALRPGSSARAGGPNGADMGAAVPPGVTFSGEPAGTTWKTSATLQVGGPGYVNPGLPNLTNYYRYRLNNGPWSEPVEISQPVVLSGLGNGSYRVQAIGRNSAGVWQDEAAATSSRTWTVDTSFGELRINEVLASNGGVLENGGTFPDAIELFNHSGQTLNLGDLSLSDNPDKPRKFIFPANTLLPSEAYLVVFADDNFTAPGLHTGFSLKQAGDDLYLFDKPGEGGVLLDSIRFGPQLTGRSVGRRTDGSWALTKPTFGGINLEERTGEAERLRINEWLAAAERLAPADFIELFNGDDLPVDLGGLHLSDNPFAVPRMHPIAPLTFIPSNGYLVFAADGQPAEGPLHLGFRLAAEQGLIGLGDANGMLIDTVYYGPQRTDVAQGRSPTGGDRFAFFAQPTPGSANPGAGASVTLTSFKLITLTNEWRYRRDGVDLGTTWRESGFDDAGWLNGRAIFYGTNLTTAPNQDTNTFISFTSPRQRTFYFRTRFVLTNEPSAVSLELRSIVDDGAVYYLNGTEILRERMPAGVIGYTNFASASAGSAVLGAPVLVPTTALVAGTNVLAIEVHQASGTSTDMALGLELAATVAVTNSFSVPVVLSEVLAENRSLTNAAGRTVDYVELFNAGDEAVDLGDFSLSNDPAEPRRFVFGGGTMIPAAGRLVVRFDNDAAASGDNTGFSLSRRGDAVYLFDRPAGGGALLDAVVFGPQVPDFALGRAGDGEWILIAPSPGEANIAAVTGDVGQLRINEWLANPETGDDWLELYNPTAQPVALGGLQLTDDLLVPDRHVVAPLTFIGAGPEAWLDFIADGNSAAGGDHVGFSLAAGGESIGFFTAADELIHAVTFGPQSSGASRGSLPDGANVVVDFATTATPGNSNFLPLPGLVVNEVLSHTDPPLEDTIELLNTGTTEIELGGWWLSNEGNRPMKFQLPADARIAPGGFYVLLESQFGGVTASDPFSLNSAHGDAVFLSPTNGAGGLTGYRASIAFGAAANGVSFGRHLTSVGADFPPQLNRTPGAPNSGPLIGPVVIDELMFQPPAGPGGAGAEFEFIELFNRSDTAVPLFDEQHATNTWRVRGGIDFDFPGGVSLAAGGRLLVVSFNPVSELDQLAAFRARYGLSEEVPMFGPFTGQLSDAGEAVLVLRPDRPQTEPSPDAGYVPYLEVERIHYRVAAPWPVGAGGTGASLQRLAASRYPNEPLNWIALPATAGSTDPDRDRDGLPDAWEEEFFGAVDDPRASPGQDADADSLTNLQEWISGTSPVNPASYLRVARIARAGNGVQLEFAAVAGRTYTIVFRDNSADGTWQILEYIAAPVDDRLVTVFDPTVGGVPARIYRLVTPALPNGP